MKQDPRSRHLCLSLATADPTVFHFFFLCDLHEEYQTPKVDPQREEMVSLTQRERGEVTCPIC